MFKAAAGAAGLVGLILTSAYRGVCCSRRSKTRRPGPRQEDGGMKMNPVFLPLSPAVPTNTHHGIERLSPAGPGSTAGFTSFNRGPPGRASLACDCPPSHRAPRSFSHEVGRMQPQCVAITASHRNNHESHECHEWAEAESDPLRSTIVEPLPTGPRVTAM